MKKYMKIISVLLSISLMMSLFNHSLYASALGDIDDSKTIDAGDASVIMLFVANKIENSFTEEQLQIADVDKNGTVDSGDAAMIMLHIADRVQNPIGSSTVITTETTTQTTSETSTQTTTQTTTETSTQTTTESTTETTTEDLTPKMNRVIRSLQFNVIPQCTDPLQIEVCNSIIKNMRYYMQDNTHDYQTAAKQTIAIYDRMSIPKQKELEKLIQTYNSTADLNDLYGFFFPSGIV